MPTRFAVSFSRKAADDLEQIWKFIAADNLSDASSFILRLEKQIDKLERFHQRCPLISENEVLGPATDILFMETTERSFVSQDEPFTSLE